MTDKLNKQTVLANMEEEIKRIKKVQHAIDIEEIQDREESEEHREPLSLEVTKEVKVLLSWGGPEDGFKLRFDADCNLLGGVYYMANWGEYEEIELNADEAELVFEFYLYGDNSFVEGR